VKRVQAASGGRPPSLPLKLGLRVLPWASVATAGASNAVAMRYKEGRDGITVYEPDGSPAGVSVAAALPRSLPSVARPAGGPDKSVAMVAWSLMVAGAVAGRLTAAARRLDVPLAMHVAESEAEADLLRAGTGSFRELFDRLGVWPEPAGPALLPAAEWISRLARGPRGRVVHGTHLGDDPEACARLARHRDRLAVAVCPRTTLALAQRLPPVALFRAAGIRVAIGTDSRASTPDLSVLAECRVLVEAGLVAPAEVVRMATVDAAWALGFERSCGILAPGRPADLAILGPSTTTTDPYEAILDPATRLTATLRAGRVIAGSLEGLGGTGRRDKA
jgi:hypothetical protein